MLANPSRFKRAKKTSWWWSDVFETNGYMQTHLGGKSLSVKTDKTDLMIMKWCAWNYVDIFKSMFWQIPKTYKRDIMIMKWYGGNATAWIYANTCCWQILVGWCTMHTLEARPRKGHKIASTYGKGGGPSRLTCYKTYIQQSDQTTPTDPFRHPKLHLWPFDSTVVFIHAEDGQWEAWIFQQQKLDPDRGP